jgi:hypothetical protein
MVKLVHQFSSDAFAGETKSAGSDPRLGAALFEPIFNFNRRSASTVVIPGFDASQSNSAPIISAR